MHKTILAERDANAQQAIIETTQEIAALLGIQGVGISRAHMRTDPILQAMLQREQIAAALKAIAAKLHDERAAELAGAVTAAAEEPRKARK